MAGPRKAASDDEGPLKGARILVVEARYYDGIADALLAGAKRALDAAQVDYDIVTVPGALEIPQAIALALDAAARRKAPYHGVVALGCVIRGETSHYDIVAGELDGSGIEPRDPGRQRHPYGRQGRAGLGARAPRGTGQGRRRGARGTRAGAAAAIARQAAGPAVKAPNPKANRRGAARLAAVQALYQMDIAGKGLNDILAEFESHWLGREVEGEQYLPAEAAFFRDIVGGFVADQRRLDPLIDQALAAGWPLKRIEAIVRAVLRAGSYELDKRSDIPARVVVSEYVGVANAFVDREETGMVNAVLDALARKFRAGEFEPATN